MAVPKYYEFYGEFLKILADGEVHYMKEIKQLVAKSMDLSEKDLEELLPSGQMTVFNSRLGWARTYLKKAGLVESPARAQFLITEEGRKALKDVDILNDEYLKRYPSFLEFAYPTKKVALETNISENDLSPAEELEDAVRKINATLSDDLLSEIMKLTPEEFERFVVKLLVKMGYGSGLEDAGVATPISNDGGIDGIIKEDQLGFSSIYIQAKKWDRNSTVSRPEIDTFIGALTRNHANKGLFVTTASFTSGAIEAAKTANIVLVDGALLAKMMIKHNYGVSVKSVYEVKEVDGDFFAEGF